MNDDNFQDTAEQLQSGASQAAKKGGRMAGRAIGKGVKKVGKAAGKAAAKLGAAAIKAIVATVGPTVLAVVGGLVLVMACSSAVLSLLEIVGPSQDYQREKIEWSNLFQLGKEEYDASDVSNYNILTQAFYLTYAEQSFYKSVVDKDGNRQLYEPGTDKFDALEDKYYKESSFYLNHNFLWAMDQYVHQGYFRYPEAFIRPLNMDLQSLTLLPLTEDNTLTAQSPAYDEEGNQLSELTDGVWQYGLAPVLNYKEFEEEAEHRYFGSGIDDLYCPNASTGAMELVTDIDNLEIDFGKGGEIKYCEIKSRMDMTEDEVRMAYGLADLDVKEASEDGYGILTGTQDIEGYPMIVHLIDQVLTFSGRITNDIEQEWASTGVDSPVLVNAYETVSVTFKKTESHHRPVTTSTGRVHQTCTIVMPDGSTIKPTNVLSYGAAGRAAESRLTIYNPVTGGSTPGLDTTNPGLTNPMELYSYQLADGTKGLAARVFGCYDTYEWVDEEVTETLTYLKEVELSGQRWEFTPMYVGTPDTSDIGDHSYLEDFIYFYQNYIPESAMTGLELDDRIETQKELVDEIIAQYQFQAGGGTAILDGTLIESSSDVSLFMSTFNQYGAIITEWSEHYGVDPYLILSIILQESSGNHESNIPGGATYNGYGVGLMQVESPGVTTTSVTARNDKTGLNETVTVCDVNGNGAAGCLNVVTSVENNIRVGIMELQGKINSAQGNIAFLLYSYNYGLNGARTIIACDIMDSRGDTCFDDFNAMSNLGRVSLTEVNNRISQTSDLTWMNYASLVSQNPSWFNTAGNRHGDANYVSNVLKYYPVKMGNPWAKDSNGNRHTLVIGDATTQLDTQSWGAKLWDFMTSGIKKAWDKIVASTKNLFNIGVVDRSLPKENAIEYSETLAPDTWELAIKMFFSMDQGVEYSSIPDIDAEYWQSYFGSFFKNPYDSDWASDPRSELPGLYFAGKNWSSPLPIYSTVIMQTFGQTGGGHDGIDLSGSPGAQVKAISDGVIFNYGTEDSHLGNWITIKHNDDTYSTIGGLEAIASELTIGVSVSRGDVIGVIASDRSQIHVGIKYQDQWVDPSFLVSKTGSAGISSSQNKYEVEASIYGFAMPIIDGAYISCSFDSCSYYTKKGATHGGTDFGHANKSAPILASAAGTVTTSGWHNSYGNYVVITHNMDGEIYTTLYAHMSQRLVNVGAQVEQGQQIGVMGNTGNSEGAHLHFEVYKGTYNFPNGLNPEVILGLR